MQQMWNGWQNEQQGQQQLQQDEEEEECQRLEEHRDLIRRQERLEEVANNSSRHDIAAYHARSYLYLASRRHRQRSFLFFI